MFRPACLFLALASAGATHAAALQAGKGSVLGFTASYDNEAFDGRFARFQAKVDFDPADLAHCRFDVRIPLATVDTRQDERDQMLRGAEFFDVSAMPEASYVAERCHRLSADRYAADGWLTLRGVRKYVMLSFGWTPGNPAQLAGEATVKRLDFKVGTGDWADTGILPNEVKVKTKLMLVPAGTAPMPAR